MHLSRILIATFAAALIAFLVLQYRQPATIRTTDYTPAVVAEPESCSTDWPNMFGASHNSISCESDLQLSWPDKGPPVIWDQTTGSGYSVPVVQNQSLVLFGRFDDWEVVECLDASTGRVMWQYGYPTSYECPYNYSSGPYSTPAIKEGRVYTIGAEGILHCLNLTDGSLLWVRNLHQEYEVPQPLFGVGHSPLVSGGMVYLNLGGCEAGIVALDAVTGETIWAATDHGASYATPRLAKIFEQDFLFVFTAEGLVSLNPLTGRVFWSVPFGVKQAKRVDAANAVSPLVYENYVLVTAGPGVGTLCLQVLPDGSYEEAWRVRRELDSQFNNLVCVDGFVYGFTSKWRRATLNCVELSTGKLKWKWRSELERGSSLAADGHLILFGEYGHLGSIEIDPEQHIPIAMTSEPLLERPCYSAPALSRGRLYLRNEQQIICFNLSRRPK